MPRPASRSVARLALALLLGLALGALYLLAPRHTATRAVAAEWRPAVALSPGVSAREGKVEQNPSWRLVDLSIDLSKAELKVASREAGGRLEEMLPSGAVAAVNGGYFDEHFRPTGWLVDGRELIPRQNRSSGGVLAIKGSQLYVGPLAELAFAPEVAVQNSPRLVEGDGQVGIHRDDGRRAARTAACDASGRLHLLAVLAPPGDGPTLLELARLLAQEPTLGGLGCQEALNLDGGPSTGVWLAPASGLASAPPPARIAYALAVVPR